MVTEQKWSGPKIYNGSICFQDAVDCCSHNVTSQFLFKQLKFSTWRVESLTSPSAAAPWRLSTRWDSGDGARPNGGREDRYEPKLLSLSRNVIVAADGSRCKAGKSMLLHHAVELLMLLKKKRGRGTASGPVDTGRLASTTWGCGAVSEPRSCTVAQWYI